MLKIVGAWTKAGVASCIKLQGPTKNDVILLDCGVSMSETLMAKTVLITHGHIDHAGACISHARGRALSGSPASYYVPVEIVDHLNQARVAMEKMDGSLIPMNIIPLRPGDTTMIGNSLKVQVIPTIHRVPSQGYAIYSINKGKLLPEFAGLTRDELKAFKSSGQCITAEPHEKLELVYTGDTTFKGLLDPSNSFIFSAPILILELTYLDGDEFKAEQYGHIHIRDIILNRYGL